MISEDCFICKKCSLNRPVSQSPTIQYSINSGVDWTSLPAHGVGNTIAALAEWDGDIFSTMAVGRMSGGVGNKLEVWAAGDVAWTDKTGNLVSDFSVANVYQIDRDTMDGGA